MPNWQRKIVALIAAIIIWAFVSHSVIATKTVAGVPIRIINLPADKTVEGILPNGLLHKRVTLTLSGSKSLVENLESSDLEVVLDATNVPDAWIVQITKKNLVSLNPSIDLAHHITQVNHQEFVLKLSRVITAKIPIIFTNPDGYAPKGYQFLSIWPQMLFHTLSGPEEQVEQLKSKGIEITFDLSEITLSDLDSIHSSQQGFYADEISYMVPEKWKKVTIHFLNNAVQDINDPEAENLRIDFLRKEFIPLQTQIPVRVFYPLKNSDQINPKTNALALNNLIKQKNTIPILSTPLFAYEVSRLFLEVVRDNMEIAILAIPIQGSPNLPWSIQFIDPHYLEDRYVASLMSHHNLNANPQGSTAKLREAQWRTRFRDYMQKLVLYKSPSHRLHLDSKLNKDTIEVSEEQG